MQDSTTVRCLDRAGDLPGDTNNGVDWHRSVERRTVHVLEHEIRRTDVENLTDVWVIQRSNGARFLLEAAHSIGIGREGLRQDFDRDIAIQTRITCAIHLAHATRTERRDDFIGTQASARAQGHGRLA